jgi:SAM-dependent methyltransferase
LTTTSANPPLGAALLQARAVPRRSRSPTGWFAGNEAALAEFAPMPAQAVFHETWRIYRTLIDENYLFHREAYACLQCILREEVRRPFRFLDVACGDATASVAALSGAPITHDHGIDLSAAALALARPALADLACPVTLEQADYVAALRTRTEPADVVWIGLSLHHLRTPQKLDVLRMIRRRLPADGHVLLYEDTSPDGEDRDGWLRRWDAQQPRWTAYTSDEWATITAHVHAADYPEPAGRWRMLAAEAGFAAAREMFVAPSDLFRLYWMPAGVETG